MRATAFSTCLRRSSRILAKVLGVMGRNQATPRHQARHGQSFCAQVTGRFRLFLHIRLDCGREQSVGLLDTWSQEQVPEGTPPA